MPDLVNRAVAAEVFNVMSKHQLPAKVGAAVLLSCLLATLMRMDVPKETAIDWFSESWDSGERNLQNGERLNG